MSDADTHALIENLQQSNRFWKRLALGLLTAFGLTILLLILSATVLSLQVVQQMRRARAAEVEARMQAEEALRQEQEARERFEQARKAVDEFQRKGRQP
jgi:uncharacterized membrane protein